MRRNELVDLAMLALTWATGVLCGVILCWDVWPPPLF